MSLCAGGEARQILVDSPIRDGKSYDCTTSEATMFLNHSVYIYTDNCTQCSNRARLQHLYH